MFSPSVALGPRFTLTGQGGWGFLLIILTASAASAAPAPPSSRDHHEREHDHVYGYWASCYDQILIKPYQIGIMIGS